MPKEWTGHSEYFAAGALYGNQSRKAIFRSILTPEGQPHGLTAMEFEEAADLSLKKEKLSVNKYDKPMKPSYSSSYGLDESIDLSTKWRAPTTSERKSIAGSPLSSGSSTQPIATSIGIDQQLEKERKGTKRSHHSHMLPRKRLHLSDKKSCSRPRKATDCSYPDVIVLSDEDPPRLNGHTPSNGYESGGESEGEPPPLPPEKIWDPIELAEKRRLLSALRHELRSEEMKLVLLKKLHQSQMIKENLLSQAAAVVAGKIVPTSGRSTSSTAAPPPLVRSGQVNQTPQNKLLNSHQSSLTNNPLQLSQNTHGGPPPLIGQRGSASSNSLASSSLMSSLMRGSHGSSRTPVTTPPNMVMGYGSLHSLQSAVQSGQHSSANITQATPQTCPSPSSISTSQIERMDGQTPAQRQAAAKLALRKQLEKTLLQIPPPKPPPPEMHFVPNANNQEFICLLGLEKIVDLITNDPSVNRPPPEPFECVQCGTDFSPVWKWQDAGRARGHKPSVICETCVTSNIKKALKAEHTNRLKTAFVKALQQEQEIEQRMSQAMPSPPPLGTSPTHTPCSTPIPSNSTVATPPAASHSPIPHGLHTKHSSSSALNSASLLQHLPKMSAAHQSLLHAQAQQLQHFAQTMQPQPAHMYPFGPLLAQAAYSYHLGKNPMSSAELQRQYLLDMIPSRSLPQGSINWKT